MVFLWLRNVQNEASFQDDESRGQALIFGMLLTDMSIHLKSNVFKSPQAVAGTGPCCLCINYEPGFQSRLCWKIRLNIKKLIRTSEIWTNSLYHSVDTSEKDLLSCSFKERIKLVVCCCCCVFFLLDPKFKSLHISFITHIILSWKPSWFRL